ncbi:MAG TPA: dTMP kinase [Burkholderiaceae bacterium]|nr:dTMP kinase [Burkholderiaceae bacterium]
MADAGVFITFEGIDGAGKSSHMQALTQSLQARGRVVTVTREPGGTPLAEQLRAMVLNAPMDGLTEALLVFAARRDHVCQVIRPALARGEVVLCDRFSDSTFAYQGGGQGLAPAILTQLEQWVQANGDANATLLQPDLTLWFDLAPAEAARRLAQARAPDRFEARGEAFFARVREAYALLAQASPQRFAQIDAAAAREQVWLRVEDAVRARGWLG